MSAFSQTKIQKLIKGLDIEVQEVLSYPYVDILDVYTRVARSMDLPNIYADIYEDYYVYKIISAIKISNIVILYDLTEKEKGCRRVHSYDFVKIRNMKTYGAVTYALSLQYRLDSKLFK